MAYGLLKLSVSRRSLHYRASASLRIHYIFVWSHNVLLVIAIFAILLWIYHIFVWIHDVNEPSGYLRTLCGAGSCTVTSCGYTISFYGAETLLTSLLAVAIFVRCYCGVAVLYYFTTHPLSIHGPFLLPNWITDHLTPVLWTKTLRAYAPQLSSSFR